MEETIVLPKLGNYAVLDFTKNNVTHQVLKVNNNFKRFSYIHFLNLKKWIPKQLNYSKKIK